MLKQKFLKVMLLSIVLPLGACGEKIDSSAIVDIHWKCDLVVGGDRTGSTEDFMFRSSGMVRHIIYPPDGSGPSFWQGDYKVDGAKFEITDRVLGSTMITGVDGPSFVGKFTRTEPHRMQFEGEDTKGNPEKVRGDCVPRS
ncbi:hypothetical protein R69619_05441 [Paraburkholderia nemoris]|jgi:hypothetical protein|uniref:hypothetical protein n=1 Tax=Paraburkholderia nemoris TaxID=2793076 RepID=UPI00190D85E0|nr:hypothetical protein [Paraburkholderia nemoris]MBK3738151.1 hypothetical protein [Paraburkholderia aspalathi]CAE6806201.1 hypothetical protein R69619_05441 [Paraburkholderia nemoris]